MDLIKQITRFEIGKRTLTAILIGCLTLIILSAISLAGFAVFQSQKANPLFEKQFINESQTVNESPPRATKVLDNITHSSSKKVYHLSAVLAPKSLRKRGISQKEIAAKQQVCTGYVKRFSKVAQQESAKFGIPASIKLAQALVESDCGCSRLATQNNNHFGIKCFSKRCKRGHCSNFSDDTHKDFFRIYKSPWESFRAHSEFLQSKRYQNLQSIPKENYQEWARGLREAGYATDKRYAEKLIEVIETMKLYELE